MTLITRSSLTAAFSEGADLGDLAAIGDADLNPGMGANPNTPVDALRPAAVLVPIVERTPDLTVLFTIRSADLRMHAGQISFPGGAIDADDPHPVDAALRETEEEIGVSRDHIRVLGRLPQYVTGTGFLVTPVVGLIRVLPALNLCAEEVADVFEAPLAHVTDPANFRRAARTIAGRKRTFYEVPYRRHVIWGATAGMLASLARHLHGDDTEVPAS